MAEGAWVPAFDSVWRHRKTKALARAWTGPTQRRHAVAGLWLELCAWARDAVETGDLLGVSSATIAEAVGLTSSRGEELIAALVASELLIGPKLHISGWEDGPGKLVEKRHQARERKQRERGRDRRPDGPVTRDSRAAEASRPSAEASTTSRQRVADQSAVRSVTRDTSARPAPVTRDMAAERPDSRASAPHALYLSRVTGDGSERSSRVSHAAEETTERTENPRTPTLSRGQDAGSDVDAALDALLEQADGRWRDALYALLMGGMTKTNVVTFFTGSRLEGSDVVVCRDAFTCSFVSESSRPFARAVAQSLQVERVRFVTEQELVAAGVEDEPPVPDA